MHVAGAVSDLDLLVPLCVRKGLHLIEDCAHAHGSQWRGRGVGSYGSFGSFSMQQSKLITAGEGGALIGNDERLLETAWNYADCGRARDRWFYHHATIGSNFRMSEWQGAVLLGQLERFPAQHAKRNENAVALGAALAEIPGLRPQKRDPRMDTQGNYCFVFHYDAAHFAGLPLRRFEEALAAEGVPMAVSYPSLSDLELFRTRNFGPTRRSSAHRRSTTRACTCRCRSTSRHPPCGSSTASCWASRRTSCAWPRRPLASRRIAEAISQQASVEVPA